jgi:hypothetical protein
MPLISVGLDAPLGHAIGNAADYLAAAFIAALDVFMLHADSEDRVLSRTQSRQQSWSPRKRQDETKYSGTNRRRARRRFPGSARS